MKPVSCHSAAQKVLRRMPETMALRITGKIEAYAADPASQANGIKALKGRPGLRLRVGDWRVIMKDGVVLDILEIGPRDRICDRGRPMMADMVTIPRAEYLRLIEAAQDLEDLAACDRAIADPGEGIPHDAMVRIIKGEPPLAVIRDWRGLNQSALARKSGVNRVQIADIEAGRSRGSVDTLKALAAALDVPLDTIA